MVRGRVLFSPRVGTAHRAAVYHGHPSGVVLVGSLWAGDVEFDPSQDGNMRGIAFAYDPSGYWIELIDRTRGVTRR